jgi:hypothetical protein
MILCIFSILIFFLSKNILFFNNFFVIYQDINSIITIYNDFNNLIETLKFNKSYFQLTYLMYDDFLNIFNTIYFQLTCSTYSVVEDLLNIFIIYLLTCLVLIFFILIKNLI